MTTTNNSIEQLKQKLDKEIIKCTKYAEENKEKFSYYYGLRDAYKDVRERLLK